MKGYPGLLLAQLGLVLTISLFAAITARRAVAPGPVYALAQVQAGLADHPRAWVGRTVWVRGMAEPCPWWGGTTRLWQCADEPLILVADPAGQVAEPLPLSQPAPNALLAVLRGLPLLHDLVARWRAVPVFTPARFRVRIHSLAAPACGGRSPCYEVLLLDTAPSGRGE